MLTVLTLFFVVYIIVPGYATTDCDDYQGCTGMGTIVDNTARCRGYFGCMSVDLDLTESAYCSGRGACWGDEIEAPNVYCRGYQGCIHTDIYPEDTDYSESSTTWCNGYYGCSSATIYSKQINCNGMYGCWNAKIDSQGYEEITVTLGGYHSGEDLIIYCRASTTICNIICNGESDGNSCTDTTVFCYGGAGQCVTTCNSPNCPTLAIVFFPPKEAKEKEETEDRERIKKQLQRQKELNHQFDELDELDEEKLLNKNDINFHFIISDNIQLIAVIAITIILFGLYCIYSWCSDRKQYTQI